MHKLQHYGVVVRTAKSTSPRNFSHDPLLSAKYDDIVKDIPWGPLYVPPERRPKPLRPRRVPEMPRIYQYDPFDPEWYPPTKKPPKGSQNLI